MTARIASLHLYPLKGGRAVDVAGADVLATGLRGDRGYMVVDEHDRFLSQREISRLALIQARLDDGGLVLRCPGLAPLRVAPEQSVERRIVRIWRDRCPADDQGEEPAAWVSRALGHPCRLVRKTADVPRQVDQRYAVSPDDVVSFADGYPMLVTSTSSLDALNRELEVPLPMNRFRPNLVVSGWEAPFCEDRVRRLRAGAVELALVKHCARCVVTTVEQATAERGEEPLRTLARIRRRGDGVLFGENAIPLSLGTLAIGDEIEVLEWAPELEPA